MGNHGASENSSRPAAEQEYEDLYPDDNRKDSYWVEVPAPVRLFDGSPKPLGVFGPDGRYIVKRRRK